MTTGTIGDLGNTELEKRKGVNFYKGGLELFMFTLIPHELYEVTKLLIIPPNVSEYLCESYGWIADWDLIYFVMLQNGFDSVGPE